MNKKVLGIAVVLMAVAMLATPFALAKPWDKPKNNEKFQSYHVTLGGSIVDSVKEYKPNEDNPNVIVQRWGNNILSYDICIGGVWDYLMGVDFEYDQECIWTAVGAPFTPPIAGILMGSTANIWRIEYTFDFSAVGDGIDGTLEMLFVYNNGESSIHSLRGTGDLQNVQIMATAVLGAHDGIVIGWPDIPPATP